MAGLFVKVAGTYRNATTWVRVAGVWRCAALWVRSGGVWRQVTACFSVSATNVSRTVNGGADCCSSVTSTAGATATTVTGGVGPFTYSWARTAAHSCSSAAFTISSSTAQDPTWNTSVCGENCTETWQVTVTDTGAGGATAQTSITVTLQQTNTC